MYDPHVESIYRFAGIFFILLTIYGVSLALWLKRPAMFKFKLIVVYTIPALLGIMYLSNIHHYITSPYRMIMGCVFIVLFQILYFREVRAETTKLGHYKTYFPDFLDIVPDMVWIKDLDNRFIYTNEAIREGLLKCSEQEAFEKTGEEIASMQQAKGNNYDFSDMCAASDDETIKRGEVCRFLEFGTVNNKFLALQVFKAPVYLTDYEGTKRLIGTMGMGRDLTYDFVDHENISALIKDGDLEKIKTAFIIHKNRDMFTGISIGPVRASNGKTSNEASKRRWYDINVFTS